MIKKLAILLICAFVFKANATHIVGGEIMYKYKGRSGSNYRYEITLFLYLDCKNGAPDAIASDAISNINVFNKDNNRIDFNLSTTANASSPQRVSDVNYKCILNKPNACIDKYTFTKEISFPANTNGYVITFERCCRNKDIENLLNNNNSDGTSSNYGATYWTEIKNVALRESSPVFKGLPPNFLCTNAPLNFDHSATDIDGDSLVYELYQPYGSGANAGNPKPTIAQATFPSSNLQIRWNGTAYSTTNQIDGQPTLSINRKTGKIYLIPKKTGQFVIGIKVLEYRKGVIIGETMRDFQFNVSDCSFEVVSSFFTPSISCNNKEVIFTNISERATSYNWDFGDPNTDADTSSLKSPTYDYKKAGDYTATLIARTSKCADTFDFDFTIKQNFTTKLPSDTLFCGNVSKVLRANINNKTYLWSTGARTQSITARAAGTYWVNVTDDPCFSRDTIIIKNEIIAANIEAPFINCSENTVQFSNTSLSAKTYRWNFGDPETLADTSQSTNPMYVYPKAGRYTATLIAKTPNCADTNTFTHTVKQNFIAKLPNDTLYCGPFTSNLKTNQINQPNRQYKWQNGDTASNININKEGKYWVEVSDLPCISRDTIIVINDLSKLNIGPDSVICRDSFVQFTYQTKPIYKTYLWNDTTFLPSVFVKKLGTYWLSTTNFNNCPGADTITFVLYPPPRVNLNDTLFCRNTTVVLDGVNYSFKTKLETKYQWNSGQQTPQIVVGNPGMYIVTVKNRLCTIIDTATIDFIKTGLELGNDTFYCGPVNRLLTPLQNYTDYTWHTDSKLKTHLATTPGKKKLTITTIEGCIESDSVLISQYPPIDGGLGNDTAICLTSTIQLKAADSMPNYTWNTGEITQSIFVNTGGRYTITVKDKFGCVISDSILIVEKADALPIEMYMPNAFTPNNDYINEYYPGNSYADPGTAYKLQLYNRWGQKVFESEKPSVQWDGKIKGVLAPQDVYVFQVTYIGCDGLERYFRGTFHVLR